VGAGSLSVGDLEPGSRRPPSLQGRLRIGGNRSFVRGAFFFAGFVISSCISSIVIVQQSLKRLCTFADMGDAAFSVLASCLKPFHGSAAVW
jgi:hypothetical protein